MGSSSNDLRLLPDAVAQAARVLPDGEVEWPTTMASEAVKALTEAGCLVLGVDLRRYDADGVTEVAWSDVGREAEPGAASAAVQAALARVGPDLADFGWALITWLSP